MAAPLWKDWIVTLGSSDSYEFKVYDGSTNSGALIYTGNAYKKPGATNVTVKVNDIIKDYLYQIMGAVAVPIVKFFSVYVGTSRIEYEQIYLCLDGETVLSSTAMLINVPITGRIQVGTPIPITKLAIMSEEILINYYNGASLTRVSLGTTADVKNFLQTCASGYDRAVVFPRFSTVDHTELGFNLTVIPKCHRWQLYYQNALGGLDCLVIEGKSVQRDKYGRVVISKAYDNTSTTIRNAGKAVVDTEVTRTWELHTGWLTDAEAGRMGHLLGSPLVYLYDCVSGVYYPVIMKTDEYQQKVTRYDGMIQYTINVELAETLKR